MKSINPIHIPFFSPEECENCINYFKEKEKYLKTLPIGNENTHKNRITTNLHQYYNFFIDNPKYISRLEEKMYMIFECEKDYPIFIQAWANIYMQNEKIEWHTHSFLEDAHCDGYTANIFLGGDENIGLTYAVHDKNIPRYYYKNIKNKLGYMIVMPNNIWHMVKNTRSVPRYTIGMTITKYSPEILKLHYENQTEIRDTILINKKNNKKNSYFKYYEYV